MYIVNLGDSWKYKGQVIIAQQKNKELINSVTTPDDTMTCNVSTPTIIYLHKK